MENRVKYWMKQIDRGDTWIANKIDVRRETVLRWRNNTQQPTLENLKRLARLFECELNDLIE